MGRPRKQIDPEQVLKLARLHCTCAEIGSVLGCAGDLIEKRFAEVVRKGRDQGCQRLRLLQWRAAEKGNVAILIWLGKQVLGQTEKVEQVGAVTVQVEWDTETPGSEPHDHDQTATSTHSTATGAE